MKKVYWTTKSGEKIDVDEMDINHLRKQNLPSGLTFVLSRFGGCFGL